MRGYHQGLVAWTRLIELITTNVAFLLAYRLRFFSPLAPAPLFVPNWSYYQKALWVINLIWLVVVIADRYEYPFGSNRRDYLRAVRGTAVGLVVLGAVSFMYRSFSYSRLVFLYFGVLDAFLRTVVREATMRIYAWRASRSPNAKRVIFIGSDPVAERLIAKFRKYPALGFRVIRHISPAGEAAAQVGAPDVAAAQQSFSESLKQLAEEYAADTALLTLSLQEQQYTPELIRICENAGLNVTVVPGFATQPGVVLQSKSIDGIPLLELHYSPLQDSVNAAIKRLLDVVVALVAIVVTAPLMAFIAMGVRLSSPGPVVFKQERVGLNNRRFMMYKFRSMRMDADADPDVAWTVENDPRRTRFGAFIRKTSLDELPQLFNVLAGHMSIVGPRPERPYYVEKFSREIPFYNLRHRVKGGITGWAQVHGLRGNTSIPDRVAADLHYIENWSPWLDIKIMLMTLLPGVRGKNAY